MGRFKNVWWKPLLTSLQIAQQIVLMAIMIGGYLVGNPDITFTLAFWSILWGATILGLFIKFFGKSYVKDRCDKSKSPREATRSDEPAADSKGTAPILLTSLNQFSSAKWPTLALVFGVWHRAD